MEGNQFKTMEKSDLREQVTDRFSAHFRSDWVHEGLASASKRSDTAIANETAKVLELITRVVRKNEDIAKLRTDASHF